MARPLLWTVLTILACPALLAASCVGSGPRVEGDGTRHDDPGATDGDTARKCMALVDEVCGVDVGGVRTCGTTPACATARYYQERAPGDCADLWRDRALGTCGSVSTSTTSTGGPTSILSEDGGMPEVGRSLDGGDLPLQTESEQPACTELVRKCCGSGDGGCIAGPVCAHARQVADTNNHTACFQALGDESAFPRCTTP